MMMAGKPRSKSLTHLQRVSADGRDMLHDALRGRIHRRACDIGVRQVTPRDNAGELVSA
jgi:hypothetical protein